MKEIYDRARALGFCEARAASVRAVSGWRSEGAWARLTAEPTAILPLARAALMLVYPYRPYAANPPRARVDAYYVASNEAHARAGALAREIADMGYAAIAGPNVPYKPLAARCGLGEYGANGLIAAGDQGSFVVLEAILTDAPLEATDMGADYAMSAACERCGACARACPTGALIGGGRVDIARCLRAQSWDEPLKEHMRPLIGDSLLGCDICRRACPRNAGLPETVEPEALKSALALQSLLAGEVKPLKPWLGANYARRGRLLSRAVLAAANLGRRDLAPAIAALADDEYAPLAEHARWALERLR